MFLFLFFYCHVTYCLQHGCPYLVEIILPRDTFLILETLPFGGFIICMSIMVSTSFSTTVNTPVSKEYWDSTNYCWLSTLCQWVWFIMFFSYNTQLLCDVITSVFHQWENWVSMKVRNLSKAKGNFHPSDTPVFSVNIAFHELQELMNFMVSFLYLIKKKILLELS